MKTALLITAALLIAISLPAFTQEFPDVPPDHWAYDAVQELVNLGIIQGYPDGTFGGRRAMSRYEFAEAIARAVPAIAEAISVDGVVGAPGPPGPAGPPGAPGVGAEELAALQRLVDEFRDELAALGVDVEALRRDVAALNERVTVLEEEVARVRFFGEANLIGRGEVTAQGTIDRGLTVFDRDGRELVPPARNPLEASSVFTDLAFGMRARVSDDAVVNAVISAGNYLPFALDPFATGAIDDFVLWNLNLDGALRLGPLGAAHVVAGRFPFQLTPLTMKFPIPDSYASVTRLDAGDYILDGGRASMNLGPIGLTIFAGKTDGIGGILTPSLEIGAGEAVPQLGGVRAVIGTGALGNVGLTYYQAGGAPGLRAEIMGADINTAIGPIGIEAEYAQAEPNTGLNNAYPGIDLSDNNIAWNAKLNFQTGRLAVGAGYTTVEANYFAPGYWMDLGNLVNLTNVKGPVADLSFALSPRIRLVASGTQLEPNDTTMDVTARTNVDRTRFMLEPPGDQLDKLTAWKAGLQFGLTAANTIDLGYEQVKASFLGASDAEERFITVGIGHSFNPNASLKLLYQIIEFEDASDPVNENYRGGIATAQFQLKY